MGKRTSDEDNRGGRVIATLQVGVVAMIGVLLTEVVLWAVWSRYTGPLGVIVSVLIGYTSVLSILFWGDKVRLSQKALRWIWGRWFIARRHLFVMFIIMLIICSVGGYSLVSHCLGEWRNVVVDITQESMPADPNLALNFADSRAEVENIVTQKKAFPSMDSEGRMRFREALNNIVQVRVFSGLTAVTFTPFTIERLPFYAELDVNDGERVIRAARPGPAPVLARTALAAWPTTYFRVPKRVPGGVLHDVAFQEHVSFGIPGTDGLHFREGYLLSYNPAFRIPNWVAYRIRGSRRDNIRQPALFQRDPDIPVNAQSTPGDYTGSGFDRGHLVSFSDMRFRDLEEVNEVYYMTAIAPQTPSLNRKTWLAIEQLGRRYAERGVGVIAGPVFSSSRMGEPRDFVAGGPEAGEIMGFFTIGKSKVAVPTGYFRILYRTGDDTLRVLAFLVPNVADTESRPELYLTSVDRIEWLTGLDFFSELPDDLEATAESEVPDRVWEE